MLNILKLNVIRSQIPKLSRLSYSSGPNYNEALSAAEGLYTNSDRKSKPVANSDQLLKKYRIAQDLKKITPKRTKKVEQQQQQTYQRTIIKEKSYTVQDKDTGLQITILGLNDKLTNTVFTNIRSKKQRDKQGKIIIEGRRLILEALDCGMKPDMVFFSENDQLRDIQMELRPFKELEIFRVPRHDLKIWSTLVTTPGILAIFPRPSDKFEVKVQQEKVPLTVICDNIREPSNLGSIIRTCAALPCEQILVLKGCCDPWDTKALRGGCGAQFRVNIKDDVKWDDFERLDFFPRNSKVFLADSNCSSERFEKVSYTEAALSNEHNVVVIGGETHGLSDNAYNFLAKYSGGQLLHIPLADGVDSLNSASALTVILFEIRRRFFK